MMSQSVHGRNVKPIDHPFRTASYKYLEGAGQSEKQSARVEIAAVADFGSLRHVPACRNLSQTYEFPPEARQGQRSTSGVATRSSTFGVSLAGDNFLRTCGLANLKHAMHLRHHRERLEGRALMVR